MDITKELIEQAKACKSAEEIVAFSKENSIELSIDDAELYLQELAEGELADEELENVAGGQEGCSKKKTYDFKMWYKREDVTFIAKVGEIRESLCVGCSYHTVTARVEKVDVVFEEQSYHDLYYMTKVSGRGLFSNGWKRRDEIERP